MPERAATKPSFEELWQGTIDTPVQRVETGENEEEEVRAADALVAWLRQLADACRSDGLISEDEHAELRACSDTFERVLSGAAADGFRATLRGLDDPEPPSDPF